MKTFILAALGAVVSLPAQVCVTYPSTAPGPWPLPIPFGRFGLTTDNVRSQILVPASAISSTPVELHSLAFHRIFPPPAVPNFVPFSRLEVRFAQTASTSGALLSGTFAQNLVVNVQPVLIADDFVWTHYLNEWNPLDLQSPYYFDPGLGDLVIDITGFAGTLLFGDPQPAGQVTMSDVSVNPTRWLCASGWTTTPPATTPLLWNPPDVQLCTMVANAHEFGWGCTSLAQPNPVRLTFAGPDPGLSQVVTINAGACKPSAIGVFVFGYSTTAAGYPLNLAVIGAPDCRLYFPVVTSALVLADAMGRATMSLTIPNQPALLGALVYTQFAADDYNAAGTGAGTFVTSNYGRMFIGL